MEHQKILNLLNEASDSKFVTRNWNIVNDFSDVNYSVGHETIYSSKVLKSHLCDYNYAYNLVKDEITIMGHVKTQIALKNCAPFIKCITKIDGTTIDDLYLAMSMYNLLEYRSYY